MIWNKTDDVMTVLVMPDPAKNQYTIIFEFDDSELSFKFRDSISGILALRKTINMIQFGFAILRFKFKIMGETDRKTEDFFYTLESLISVRNR